MSEEDKSIYKYLNPTYLRKLLEHRRKQRRGIDAAGVGANGVLVGVKALNDELVSNPPNSDPTGETLKNVLDLTKFLVEPLKVAGADGNPIRGVGVKALTDELVSDPTGETLKNVLDLTKFLVEPLKVAGANGGQHIANAGNPAVGVGETITSSSGSNPTGETLGNVLELAKFLVGTPKSESVVTPQSNLTGEALENVLELAQFLVGTPKLGYLERLKQFRSNLDKKFKNWLDSKYANEDPTKYEVEEYVTRLIEPADDPPEDKRNLKTTLYDGNGGTDVSALNSSPYQHKWKRDATVTTP